MCGFEGADHVNALGLPLDMRSSNDHLGQLEDDYRRAARLGLRTVRESIGWRLTEGRPGEFDLSRPRACMQAAKRHGIQIVWTLMHYGTPADLLITEERFVERYIEFASEVARRLRDLHEGQPIYNPINEISFLAWAVTETNMMSPYRNEYADRSIASGYELKRTLVRAVLGAMRAMREHDPRIRFVHIEPVVHVVAPPDRPELQALALQVRDYQWQTWDMLCGRLAPELGGSPEALDVIGLNHYASSQWEVMTEARLQWHMQDERWMPLSGLLHEVWERYRRPLVVMETGHVGEGRVSWMNDVGASAQRALSDGVPLLGVCLYPAVDRHDWSDPDHWHHSGLWDVVQGEGMDRRLNFHYARALRRWQRRLKSLSLADGSVFNDEARPLPTAACPKPSLSSDTITT
jgi:beta-glucosidase/6-phospho-beta-glucosidase/beta-galactosidase